MTRYDITQQKVLIANLKNELKDLQRTPNRTGYNVLIEHTEHSIRHCSKRLKEMEEEYDNERKLL